MTKYLIMTINPNGENSSFRFDDYQLARSYARSKSISNRGADVIVNGMGSNMFMYRNGVKCDLGGNELTGNSGHMKKEETISRIVNSSIAAARTHCEERSSSGEAKTSKEGV